MTNTFGFLIGYKDYEVASLYKLASTINYISITLLSVQVNQARIKNHQEPCVRVRHKEDGHLILLTIKCNYIY